MRGLPLESIKNKMKKTFISKIFNEARTIRDADCHVRLHLGHGLESLADDDILFGWDKVIGPLLDDGLTLQEVAVKLKQTHAMIAEIAIILDEFLYVD